MKVSVDNVIHTNVMAKTSKKRKFHHVDDRNTSSSSFRKVNVSSSSSASMHKKKSKKKSKKVRTEAETAALRQRIENGLVDIRALEALIRNCNGWNVFPTLRKYLEQYIKWTLKPRSIRFQVNHMELAATPLRTTKFVYNQTFKMFIPNIMNRTALQRRIFIRFQDESVQFYDIEFRIGTKKQFQRTREKDTVVVNRVTEKKHVLTSVGPGMGMELTYKDQKGQDHTITHEVIGNPRTKVLNVYFCGEIGHEIRVTTYSNYIVKPSNVKMYKINNNKLVNVSEFIMPTCLSTTELGINGSWNMVDTDEIMRDCSYNNDDSDMEEKHSLPPSSPSPPSSQQQRHVNDNDHMKDDDDDNDSMDLSRGDLSFLGFLASSSSTSSSSMSSADESDTLSSYSSSIDPEDYWYPPFVSTVNNTFPTIFKQCVQNQQQHLPAPLYGVDNNLGLYSYPYF